MFNMQLKNKWMIVSNNTIAVEGLGDFFKSLDKSPVKLGRRIAKKVLQNPGRALDTTANIASGVASWSPRTTLSTLPEAMNVYHTGKGINLGKPKWVYTIQMKQKTLYPHSTHLHH